MNTTEMIALPAAGQTVELAPSGRGMYEFHYAPTLVTRTSTNRLFVVRDLWCGDRLEGWCYRSHIAEISEESALKVAAAVDPEEAIAALPLHYIRASRAPVWLESLHDKARKS